MEYSQVDVIPPPPARVRTFPAKRRHNVKITFVQTSVGQA